MSRFRWSSCEPGGLSGTCGTALAPYKNANLGWVDHYRQNRRPIAMVVHLYVYPHKEISQRGLPKELVASWLGCPSWYAHETQPVLIRRHDALEEQARAA